MNRLFLRNLTFFAFLGCVVAVLIFFVEPNRNYDLNPKVEAFSGGFRIFSTSHSFNWDVPGQLAELAASVGLNEHKQIGLQRIGSSRTLAHWQLSDERNMAKKALILGDTEVFTMSPLRVPDEGIDNFVKLGLEHNPNMRFTVQVSWAAWDVDMQITTGSATQAKNREKTPEQLIGLNEMNVKAVEEQITKINKQYGRPVIFEVPTSQAHIALRTMIFNKQIRGLQTQEDLFTDAIGHPTPPVQVLNTYLHFAVIYRRSPIGLPIPIILRDSHIPQWNEAFNRTLQEIAWKTVTDCPLSGVVAPPRR